jgi:glutamine synthetase
MLPEGRAFIAGILNRVQEFTMFSNPTINSYERFGARTAPSRINWSDENRTPLIQLLYAPGEDAFIEIRSADAYCNPYITFQMLLNAGMAGIAGNETLTENMNAANDNASFATLPKTLEDAIVLAEKSEFVQSVLPATLIQDFSVAMWQQVQDYTAAPDKQEFCFNRYF